MELSVIIPVFNCCSLTQKCLETLYSSFRFEGGAFDDFEVIVVDNASTDATQAMLAAGNFPRLRVVRNSTNVGFGPACNQAAGLAKGRFLIFLNNDTEVLPGSLLKLHSTILSDPTFGVVGCRLLYPDGTIQHAGVAADADGEWVHIFRGMPADHPAALIRRPFQVVTGACQIVSKRLFEELGGFDDRFLNCHEDVDFCLRVGERGLQVIYEPEAVLVHRESQTEGRKNYQYRDLLIERWRGRFKRDLREKTKEFIERMASEVCSNPAATGHESTLWRFAARVEDMQHRLNAAFRDSVAMADELKALNADAELLRRRMDEQAGVIDIERARAEAAESSLGIARAKVERMADDLKTAHAVIAEQEGRLLESGRVITEIRSSLSWRITEPLRRIADALGLSFPDKNRFRIENERPPSADGGKPRVCAAAAPCSALMTDSQDLNAAARGIAFREEPSPAVSIVIPAHGQIRSTLACLKSIECSTDSPSFEVILIDDCSPDETSAVIPLVRGLVSLKNTRQLGFLRSCNLAAKRARGKYIVLLNNDCFPLPNWLSALHRTFSGYPDAGLVGAKLISPDGNLQEAGGIIWPDGSGWNYGRGEDPADCRFNFVRDVDYCSGACVMIPSSLWKELGGFDELYSPAYYEDTDLAFRVRAAGHRVLYQPASEAIHAEGTTSGTDASSGEKRHQELNRPKFTARWGETIAGFRSSDDPIGRFIDRRNRSRILVIDATTPTPDQDSGSVDAFQFMRIFRNQNMGVTFIPQHNFAHAGRYTLALQSMGVECIYRPYFADLKSYLRKEGRRFDVVMLSRAPVAHDCLGVVRKYAPQSTTIFNTVDLHFLRLQREAAVLSSPKSRIESEDMRAKELAVVTSTDCTLVVSDAERKLLNELCPSARVEVVNLPREIPGRSKPYEARRNIAFLGGFQHPPNVDAVFHLAREIWPRVRQRMPGVVLEVFGSNVPPFLHELSCSDIHIRGHIEDLDDIFSSCRLSVAPLRYGAGVKGKIVTSLSYGVPCVATPVAAEGMGLTDGQDILVAETPAAFAEAIAKAYASAELWLSLSEGGLRLVRERFSIEAVAERLRAVLQTLCPATS